MAPISGATAFSQNDPNPLARFPSLHVEDLTWVDVRDRLRDGVSTVIIPTGGIEQNGPYVALNKHDLIVRAVSARAAAIDGATLVAPVVSFVPEGLHSPPTGHMTHPGTISLSDETFVRIVSEVAVSFVVHGFSTIVLVGDSKESQGPLQEAATRIQRQVGDRVRVAFAPQFYDYDDIRTLLKARGYRLGAEPFHEELAFTAQLAAISPIAIRFEERIAAGKTELGGDSLLPKEALQSLGQELIERRARTLAEYIAGLRTERTAAAKAR